MIKTQSAKLKTQNYSSKFKSIKLSELKNTKERREFLGKELGVSLENIGCFSLDEKVASGKNCENMIGAAQLPLGIAGPLKLGHLTPGVKNQKRLAFKKYYIPLATTEGALVASVNRGCKVTRLSGGVNVYVSRVGATRGPVFYTGSILNSRKFYKWLRENEPEIKKKGEETSSHLRVTKIVVKMLADCVFVRFYFDTQDAMGMNMATIAADKMAQFIEQNTQARCVSVAGNFDIDKKPAWLNFLSNRGFKAWAEVVLSGKIVQEVLKVRPEEIHEVVYRKIWLGSAMAGSLGFNAHYANIIAALFIATGQDPAHVVEGSLGITTTNILSNGDLYFSVYLPALMVGTVGGGTGLATQKEALEILGVSGGREGKNAERFAEIVAGAVLAGELSLISSEAEGSLARAHQRLRRQV